MSLIVGVIWYGAGDAISPTGDSLTFGTGIARGGLMVLYIAIHFLWLAGLAMFLSVSTDAPLGAVGGAVLISIVSQILDTITALEGLRNYLPTHYAFAWSDLLSSEIDWSEMARGALSAVLYGSIFTALAIRRFLRKDITS
jgi:ABC-2 type transport system permease protein